VAKKDFGSGLIDRTLAKMAGAQVDTCARYRVYEGAERSACNKIQHKARHSALSNTPLTVKWGISGQNRQVFDDQGYLCLAGSRFHMLC